MPIFKTLNPIAISNNNYKAKITANGTIWLQLDIPQHFRKMRTAVHAAKIPFGSFTLSDHHFLKIVKKVIPKNLKYKKKIHQILGMIYLTVRIE